jgi:hypothetical protein
MIFLAFHFCLDSSISEMGRVLFMSYRYDATVAFVFGLAALIFSTQFFPIESNIVWALVLLILGIVGLLYGVIKWRDVD